MFDWAMTYWYLCLVALIIGVATAAWIWLRVDANATITHDDDDAGIRPSVAAPTVPLEPVRPVIDVAEPVNFAAVPVAAPVADIPMAPAGLSIAPAVGEPDDLTLIKGVGPKLNQLLISLGVRRFDQIAAWLPADIAEVDQHLGAFKGRIARDGWVEQAGYLARGDHAGFSARFGELGSENK